MKPWKGRVALKSVLAKRGLTLSQWARDLGVSSYDGMLAECQSQDCDPVTRAEWDEATSPQFPAPEPYVAPVETREVFYVDASSAPADEVVAAISEAVRVFADDKKRKKKRDPGPSDGVAADQPEAGEAKGE